MGDEMTVTGAFFVNNDSGEVFKWDEIVDISETEITTDAPKGEEYTIYLNRNQEYILESTFFMSRAARKRIWLNFIIGWRAKGPLRKKGLKKALKLQKPFDWGKWLFLATGIYEVEHY